MSTLSAGARDSAIHANNSSVRCIEPIVALGLNGRRPLRRRECRDSPSLRVLDLVADADQVRGFHDQTVADAVEGLEHHESTGLFRRKSDFLRAQLIEVE